MTDCKHDWVGDDSCPYCRLDALQAAAIKACSDMGCFCDQDDCEPDEKCPMCELEVAIRAE